MTADDGGPGVGHLYLYLLVRYIDGFSSCQVSTRQYFAAMSRPVFPAPAGLPSELRGFLRFNAMGRIVRSTVLLSNLDATTLRKYPRPAGVLAMQDSASPRS